LPLAHHGSALVTYRDLECVSMSNTSCLWRKLRREGSGNLKVPKLHCDFEQG
jgi:hypothetical protein